jgi:hypothetical protein
VKSRLSGIRGQPKLGIDGDYIGRNSLTIPPDCFRAGDLNRPLEFDERLDLAVCLEVAELIPPAAGATLVQFALRTVFRRRS